MALKRLDKELRALQVYQEEGSLPVGCRFYQNLQDSFQLNLAFDIGTDGLAVGVVVQFPSDYPFSAPKIRVTHKDYSHLLISVAKADWGPYVTLISLVWHIYLSIIDPAYYKEKSNYGVPLEGEKKSSITDNEQKETLLTPDIKSGPS